MNNKKLICLIIFFVLAGNTTAQRLWDYTPTTSVYVGVGGDTTLNYLKDILMRDSLAHRIVYTDAAYLLAYYYGNTEKDFILQKLRIYADRNSPNFRWYNYFAYQKIRGFLGDTGAIAGMDTIVLFSGDKEKKLAAIMHLAIAGRFNYFQIVKDAFYAQETPKDGYDLLGIYGKNPQFRNEAGNLLATVVQESTSHSKIYRAAINLAEFDKPRAVQILEQRFRTSSGETRYRFFWNLRNIDPDGSPERTMFAVPLEPDEHLRISYLPPIFSVIKEGILTSRYLLPFYIKFTKDALTNETSVLVRWHLREILENFIPLPPKNSVTIIEMIDSLFSTKHQVASYGWVGDNNFVTELDNHLNSAKNFLVSGDSLGCAKQIFNFQKKVNEEYKDSLDGDTRFINTEGWKFLYYNADYILERLPGIITITSYIDSSWNMISIPVDPPNFSKSEIYPNSVSSAYIFKPDTGYVATNQLENGIGFWLKFNKRDTVNYRGFVIEKETIDVKTGWNLIGTISTVLDTNKVQTLPEGIMLSKFFGFSKNLGYFITNKLYPGRAYWIKVSQPGKLILDKYSLSGGSQGSEPLPPPPPGAPEVPELYLPVNGSSSISRTPTLHWYESNNAQSYRLQLSTNSNFTSIVYDDSTITTSSKTVGPLSNSTTHYWRVRAKNDIWTSDWSPIWYFRTQGSQPDPCEPIEALTAMDEIIITDANGNSQKLYMYNGGRRIALGLRDYEMPPEPVEGIFHARFHSNKFIENIPPGKGIIKIPIKIKSAKYPVEIFWNIKSESKTKYWLYKTKNQKIEISGNNKVKINNIENDTLNIDAQALLPGPCY